MGYYIDENGNQVDDGYGDDSQPVDDGTQYPDYSQPQDDTQYQDTHPQNVNPEPLTDPQYQDYGPEGSDAGTNYNTFNNYAAPANVDPSPLYTGEQYGESKDRGAAYTQNRDDYNNWKAQAQGWYQTAQQDYASDAGSRADNQLGQYNQARQDYIDRAQQDWNSDAGSRADNQYNAVQDYQQAAASDYALDLQRYNDKDYNDWYNAQIANYSTPRPDGMPAITSTYDDHRQQLAAQQEQYGDDPRYRKMVDYQTQQQYEQNNPTITYYGDDGVTPYTTRVSMGQPEIGQVQRLNKGDYSNVQPLPYDVTHAGSYGPIIDYGKSFTDAIGQGLGSVPSRPTFGNSGYQPIDDPFGRLAEGGERFGKVAGNLMGAAFAPLGGAAQGLRDSDNPAIQRAGITAQGIYNSAIAPAIGITQAIVGTFAEQVNRIANGQAPDISFDKWSHNIDKYDPEVMAEATRSAALAQGASPQAADNAAQQTREFFQASFGINRALASGEEQFAKLPAAVQFAIMMLDPIAGKALHLPSVAGHAYLDKYVGQNPAIAPKLANLSDAFHNVVDSPQQKMVGQAVRLMGLTNANDLQALADRNHMSAFEMMDKVVNDPSSPLYHEKNFNWKPQDVEDVKNTLRQMINDHVDANGPLRSGGRLINTTTGQEYSTGRSQALPEYAGSAMPLDITSAKVEDILAGSLEQGGLRVGALKENPDGGTMPTRPLEQWGKVGEINAALGKGTGALARLWLNQPGRMVRDGLGNVVKAWIEGVMPHQLIDTANQKRMEAISGDKDVPLGPAGSSQDVGGNYKPGAVVKEALYTLLNAPAELSEKIVRYATKDKEFNWNKGTEGFEAGVKQAFNRKFVLAEYDRQIDNMLLTGELQPYEAKMLRSSALTPAMLDQVHAAYLKDALPPGVNPLDYADGHYHPNAISPTILPMYQKVMDGTGGPIGDIMDKHLKALDAQITASGLNPREVGPGHPLFDQAVKDMQDEVNKFAAVTAGSNLADVNIGREIRQATQQAFTEAARNGDISSVQYLVKQRLDRERQLYTAMASNYPVLSSMPVGDWNGTLGELAQKEKDLYIANGMDPEQAHLGAMVHHYLARTAAKNLGITYEQGFRLADVRQGDNTTGPTDPNALLQSVRYRNPDAQISQPRETNGAPESDIIRAGRDLEQMSRTESGPPLQALRGRAYASGVERQIQRAVESARPEITYQLLTAKSGYNWYTRQRQIMEANMTQVFPELARPEMMAVFKAVVGATSNGVRPPENLDIASRVWDLYRNSNFTELPVTQANGTGWSYRPFMGENLAHINTILDRLGGAEAFERYVNSEQPLTRTADTPADAVVMSDLNPDIVAEWNEGATTAPGWLIFTPKIGSFANNLSGHFETLTMDMWWSRTWNRWMGTVMGMFSKKGSDGVRRMVPGPFDAPRTNNERRVMREAANRLASEFGMSVAELQAVLWYYEQQLWTARGVESSRSEDYADASRQIADERLGEGRGISTLPSGDTGSGSGEAGARGTDAASGGADRTNGATRAGDVGDWKLSLESQPGADSTLRTRYPDLKQVRTDYGDQAAMNITSDVTGSIWSPILKRNNLTEITREITPGGYGADTTPSLQATVRGTYKDAVRAARELSQGLQQDSVVVSQILPAWREGATRGLDFVHQEGTLNLKDIGTAERVWNQMRVEEPSLNNYGYSILDNNGRPMMRIFTDSMPQREWDETVKPAVARAFLATMHDMDRGARIKASEFASVAKFVSSNFKEAESGRDYVGRVRDTSDRESAQHLERISTDARQATEQAYRKHTDYFANEPESTGQEAQAADVQPGASPSSVGRYDQSRMGLGKPVDIGAIEKNQSLLVNAGMFDQAAKINQALEAYKSGSMGEAQLARAVADAMGSDTLNAEAGGIDHNATAHPDGATADMPPPQNVPTPIATGRSNAEQYGYSRNQASGGAMENAAPDGQLLQTAAPSSKLTGPRTPGGAAIKGATTFKGDTGAIIEVFNGADVSTVVHELFHAYQKYIPAADNDILLKFAGLAPGSAWTPNAQEHVARAFEYYMRQGGKSPMPELDGAFARMSTFMRGIYKTVKGSPLVKTTPEVDAVFGRAMGSDINPMDSSSGVDSMNSQQAIIDRLNSTPPPKGAVHPDRLPDLVTASVRRGSNPVRMLNTIAATDRWVNDISDGKYQVDHTTLKVVRSDSEVGNTIMGQEPPTSNLMEQQKPRDFETIHKVLQDKMGAQYGKPFSSMSVPEKEDAYTTIAKEVMGVDPFDPHPIAQRSAIEAGHANALIDQYVNDAAQRHSMIDPTLPNLGQQAAAGADARVDQVTAARLKATAAARDAGYKKTDQTFFDYRNKNLIDQALGNILPFNYWARRNFAWAMRHFVDQPQHLAAVLNFYTQLEKENDEREGKDNNDFVKGDIFLWQNADGSRLYWRPHSLLSLNPAQQGQQMLEGMHLVMPGDSTYDQAANKQPLAVLFGSDRHSKGDPKKITGRDRGLVSGFFSINPLLDILTKTGQVNQFFKDRGWVNDGFGSPDPSPQRGQRQTIGIVPATPYYNSIGAATGITQWAREQAAKAGIQLGDLNLEGAVNAGLFGPNAGLPATAIKQELTKMVSEGSMNQHAALLALADFNSGRMSPDLFQALDRVNAESAFRKSLALVGFQSSITNTPRQQLAGKISNDYAAMKKTEVKGHYEIDPETGKKGKYIKGDAENFFDANPEASVAFAGNQSAVEIKHGMDKSEEIASRNAAFNNKSIGANQRRLILGELDNKYEYGESKDRAAATTLNTNLKQEYPDQVYGESKDRGAVATNDKSLDDKYYAAHTDKTAPATQAGKPLPELTGDQRIEYAKWLDGHTALSNKEHLDESAAAAKLVAEGKSNEAAARYYNRPDYKAIKEAQDKYLRDNPDFARRYAEEQGKKYGDKARDSVLKVIGDIKNPADTNGDGVVDSKDKAGTTSTTTAKTGSTGSVPGEITDDKQVAYAQWHDARNQIGGDTWDQMAKKQAELRAAGRVTEANAITQSAEYKAIKAQRDQNLKDNKEFALQYAEEQGKQYGQAAKDAVLKVLNGTASTTSGTSTASTGSASTTKSTGSSSNGKIYTDKGGQFEYINGVKTYIKGNSSGTTSTSSAPRAATTSAPRTTTTTAARTGALPAPRATTSSSSASAPKIYTDKTGNEFEYINNVKTYIDPVTGAPEGTTPPATAPGTAGLPAPRPVGQSAQVAGRVAPQYNMFGNPQQQQPQQVSGSSPYNRTSPTTGVPSRSRTYMTDPQVTQRRADVAAMVKKYPEVYTVYQQYLQQQGTDAAENFLDQALSQYLTIDKTTTPVYNKKGKQVSVKPTIQQPPLNLQGPSPRTVDQPLPSPSTDIIEQYFEQQRQKQRQRQPAY